MLDDLHHFLVRDAEQQSEIDFACMSTKNGITDGTKMCGSEQVGNCFVFASFTLIQGKVDVEGNER